MERREAIKKLITALTGFALTPLLAHCDETNINPKGKIIVVGAGVSGLYAAFLLQEKGFEVEILEASNKFGGRIKELKLFADFPIELGAEEVHGQRSLYKQLLNKTNANIVESPNTNEDFFWLDNQFMPETDVNVDGDYRKLQVLIDELQDFQGNDLNMQDYIQQKGITNRLYKIANAQIGNEYGTSNTRISVKGITQSEQLWSAGDRNYTIKNRSHYSLIEELFAPILDKIKYETVVKKISHTPQGIAIDDEQNQRYRADRVLLTVPLKILQDNDIAFNPPLPNNKIQAINAIGFGAGMKIILKFNARFWDSNLGSIYGLTHCPEIWSASAQKNSQMYVLTAFINGEDAETMSKENNYAIDLVLSQLKKCYGSATINNAFTNGYIADWSKEPFIKGSYSYPKPNAPSNIREILAQNIDNKLYFAGEATNTNGHFATIHGAMETAQIAANDIIKSF